MSQFSIPAQEQDYLRRFHSVFHSRDEAEKYLYDSWARMQVVLGFLARVEVGARVHKILELGSNPYYMTLLIKKHFGVEPELANYFGDTVLDGRHTHIVEGNGERHEFNFSHFNLEVDPFPYRDQSFECVLFCEILEHLLLNPDAAVAEMRRVLRPDGYLILTTPNATRLGNLVRLLKGKNIHADYSPYGIYGRHNREYTLQEVQELLQRHGFESIDAQVRNIYPHPLKSRVIQALRPKVWREHIFVLAQTPTA